MSANKVILNGETLIDLTEDTATESDVIRGKSFHKANGERVVGTYSGGAGGGDKPTLFTPSIKINSGTSELIIADENGGFEIFYDIYANDEFITTLSSKTATLKDYIEHTETIQIKVQAVSENFNPSEYAVIEWKYVNVNGTPGIVYQYNGAGMYAECIDEGDAIDADIVIASVYEGNTVKNIKSRAFSQCNFITSVVIPDTILWIQEKAFYNCDNLANITLGNSLRQIGVNAFSFCENLTVVEMPNSLTELANSAFEGCSGLKRVDLSNHTSIPTLGSYVFRYTSADLQIKVPVNLIVEWKSATNWSDYADKIVTEFTNEV